MAHARPCPVARFALLAASAALQADGACASPSCGAGGDALGLLQTRGAARLVGDADVDKVPTAEADDVGQVPRGEGGALALNDRGNSTEMGDEMAATLADDQKAEAEAQAGDER